MKNQNQEGFVAFDKKHAASYDKQNEKLAAMRDVLHLLTRAILSELPANARILCVGAGTGLEIVNLAQAFPGWHFTALDPSGPMLDVCRKRVEENGLTNRCTFHEGYLESLPPSEPFHAATCFLVSHFLQPDARRDFFRQIAAHLVPGGILVSSDLASDTSTTTYNNLFEVWVRLLKSSDWPGEQVERLRLAYTRDVSILPPDEVASLIASSGFETPNLFLQTILIHAWYSVRKSSP